MPFHNHPKTLEHYKDNLKELTKIHKKTSKLATHHTEQAEYAHIFNTRIFPAWERMGMMHRASPQWTDKIREGKSHQAQAVNYQRVADNTKKAIETHKAKIKEMTPLKVKNPKMQVTPKSKTHRPLVTHSPNEHHAIANELKEVIASTKLVQDSNYYKRLGKLFHLSIDKDCQHAVRKMEGASTEDMAKTYADSYKKHPLYGKLEKYMRKAAKRMTEEGVHTTTIATDYTPNIEQHLTTNLMYSLYQDSARDLHNSGVKSDDPRFDDMLVLGLKKHPRFHEVSQILGE